MILVINRSEYMKNYTTYCPTRRFLYHVSYKSRRGSIEKNGIKGSSSGIIGYHNAVFAHNSNVVTLTWYPFTLDIYEWDDLYYEQDENGDYHYVDMPGTELLMAALEKYYDIWRIDAKKLARPWCYDDVGERDFERSLFKKEGLYVMCKGSIPVDCVERVSPVLKRKSMVTTNGIIDTHQLILP